MATNNGVSFKRQNLSCLQQDKYPNLKRHASIAFLLYLTEYKVAKNYFGKNTDVIEIRSPS